MLREEKSLVCLSSGSGVRLGGFRDYRLRQRLKEFTRGQVLEVQEV
jgi:hypothetical protein